jgi:hypothetical protein
VNSVLLPGLSQRPEFLLLSERRPPTSDGEEGQLETNDTESEPAWKGTNERTNERQAWDRPVARNLRGLESISPRPARSEEVGLRQNEDLSLIDASRHSGFSGEAKKEARKGRSRTLIPLASCGGSWEEGSHLEDLFDELRKREDHSLVR